MAGQHIAVASQHLGVRCMFIVPLSQSIAIAPRSNDSSGITPLDHSLAPRSIERAAHLSPTSDALKASVLYLGLPSRGDDAALNTLKLRLRDAPRQLYKVSTHNP